MTRIIYSLRKHYTSEIISACFLLFVYLDCVFSDGVIFFSGNILFRSVLSIFCFLPLSYFVFASTDHIIRVIDVFLSVFGLVILSPAFIVFSIMIKGSSKGSIFFSQWRVGKNGKDFRIYKFRTMRTNAENFGALTVGSEDSRITRIGYFLRKYKFDELPQLLNVLKGDMSIVGPRPEVRKYVQLYTEEQQKVLSVRPGITDYASIKFRRESDLLKAAQNPEEFYIEEVMPAKLALSKFYLENKSVIRYFKVIIRTFFDEGKLDKEIKLAHRYSNVLLQTKLILEKESFNTSKERVKENVAAIPSLITIRV